MTHTWEPQHRNGWWPRQSVTPEGQIFVTFGAGQCYLAELRLLAGGALELVDEVALEEARHCPGGQWLTPYVFLSWRERGDGWYERVQCDVRVKPWRLVVVESGPGHDAGGLVGGNESYARDGHFSEWVAEVHGVSRLRLDGAPPAALVWGAGPGVTCEGWFAYTRAYQGDGPLVLRDPSGAEREYLNLCALTTLRLGPAGHAAYGNGGPSMFGQIGETARMAAWDLRTAPAGWYEAPGHLWRGADGRVWLASVLWSNVGDMGVALRPWGDTEAVWYRRPVTHVDVVERGGFWLVATSDDVGRGQVATVPVDSPRAAITVPEYPIPPMPPYDRFMWTGPYLATSDRYGAHLTPGNCEILHEGRWEAMRSPRPVWASAAYADGVPDHFYLGGFASCEGGLSEDDAESNRKFSEALEIERAKAHSKGERGVLVNYDGGSIPRWFIDRYVRRGLDVASVEAYPFSPTITVAEILARVRADIATVREAGHRRVAIVRPFYDQPKGDGVGYWNINTVRALQEPLTALIRDEPMVVADTWFPWGRPGGVVGGPWGATEFQAHPEFIPVARELEAGVVGSEPPDFLVDPKPPDPVDPIEPEEPEDAMHSQELFEKHIDATTDIAMEEDLYPGVGREHIRKSVEGAGNPLRANGVNALCNDMLNGMIVSRGTGDLNPVFLEQGTDHMDAVQRDRLMTRCVEADRKLAGGGGGGCGGGTGDPLPPGKPRVPAGIVSVNHRALRDDAGTWAPLGTTLFAAPWAEKHDVPRLEYELGTVSQAACFDFLRSMTGTAGSSWEGRSLPPADVETVARLADRVWERGLRLAHTIFADGAAAEGCATESDRARVVDAYADMVRGREQKFLSLELVNELFNGMKLPLDEVRELVQRLQAKTSVLVIPSCPSSPEDYSQLYFELGARAANMHGDRGFGDGGRFDPYWKPYEFPWQSEQPEFPLPDVDCCFWLEGIGPGSSGNSDYDPMRVCLGYIATSMLGCTAHVLHTNAGIRMGGPWAEAHGVPEHLDQVENWDRFVLGFRNARAQMIGDVANWRGFAGHRDECIIDFRLYREPPPNGPFDDGTLFKSWVATAGSALHGFILRLQKELTFAAKQPMEVEVRDPQTWEVLARQELAAGGRMTVAPRPPSGWNWDGDAYVLTGRV